MNLRPLTLGLAAGALGLVLAGCGGDGGSPPRAEETPTSTAPGSADPARPVEFRVVLATDAEPAPDSEVLQQFSALDCRAAPEQAPADEPTALCDARRTKYSLEPAVVVGGVEDAAFAVPEGKWSYAVVVQLDDEATAAFADLTAESASSRVQVAVVLDGRVVSAPTIRGGIPDGRLQVSGGLTERAARDLASRLSES